MFLQPSVVIFPLQLVPVLPVTPPVLPPVSEKDEDKEIKNVLNSLMENFNTDQDEDKTQGFNINLFDVSQTFIE